MNLFDRVFAQKELREAPPVLVDIGAAGEIHAPWRQIAHYAVGVGFEPDAREAKPLTKAQRLFKRWVFCPEIVVPQKSSDGTAKLYLTRAPQCSSTLRPNQTALSEWAFAESFTVESEESLPATTVAAALHERGIQRIDWLKCDTQGLDLRLYFSLPESWRVRLLAAEFEPGLTDVYVGEDQLTDVLAGMRTEPFWLAGLDLGKTPRARLDLLARHFGGASRTPWVRRLAAGAPAWANVRFLRDPARMPEALDLRAYLLGWVFATMCDQHGQALTVAHLGAERFEREIFCEMQADSVRRLKWAMARRLPAMMWRVGRRWLNESLLHVF